MAVPANQQHELKALANAMALKLEESDPLEILDWAIGEFGPKFCITASMADAVLIDMVSKVSPGVDVIFLDTGYHFPETLETKEKVAQRYPINLLTAVPKQTIEQQDEMFGPKLHDRDPDACCNLRKVEPLRRTIEPYYAWASGIRRDETVERSTIGVVEWDSNRAMVKVNPMAAWTQADVDRYIAENDVVLNPLLSQGYPSIGCAPCTAKVAPGADPRSGRWAGKGKTECGLHLG